MCLCHRRPVVVAAVFVEAAVAGIKAFDTDTLVLAHLIHLLESCSERLRCVGLVVIAARTPEHQQGQDLVNGVWKRELQTNAIDSIHTAISQKDRSLAHFIEIIGLVLKEDVAVGCALLLALCVLGALLAVRCGSCRRAQHQEERETEESAVIAALQDVRQG